MAQDWDIKPRSDTCAGCKIQFLQNQRLHSTLIFGAEGYVRADYCDKCSPEAGKAGSPLSVWKGTYKLPLPKPEPLLKKETAESLLRKLMEDDDATKRNVMYILGAMLERNRLLVERDVQTRDDGVKIRVYEHRKTGETFLIPDPGLKLDQLDTVRQEVSVMLGLGPDGKKIEGEPGSPEVRNQPPSPGGYGVPRTSEISEEKN